MPISATLRFTASPPRGLSHSHLPASTSFSSLPSLSFASQKTTLFSPSLTRTPNRALFISSSANYAATNSKIDTKFGGGGGGGTGGDGGKNGGGGGGGDDSQGNGGSDDKNKEEALMALAEAGRSLESLPDDYRLMKLGGFLAKVARECGVGVSTKTAAGYQSLRENFFNELDIVFADVVRAIITDFMLVNLLSSTVSLRPALAANAEGFPTSFHNCPDNAFQLVSTGAMAKYAPGYRFVPKDEELVDYLKMRINNDSIPVPEVIRDANVYGCNPWKLIADTFPEGRECNESGYFFSLRDRKYPNGSRPNRKAGDGYWKAANSCLDIKKHGKIIGQRRSLNFLKGEQPIGQKTRWMMHEYTLFGELPMARQNEQDMSLDWVLCYIYQRPQRRSDPLDFDVLVDNSAANVQVPEHIIATHGTITRAHYMRGMFSAPEHQMATGFNAEEHGTISSTQGTTVEDHYFTGPEMELDEAHGTICSTQGTNIEGHHTIAHYSTAPGMQFNDFENPNNWFYQSQNNRDGSSSTNICELPLWSPPAIGFQPLLGEMMGNSSDINEQLYYGGEGTSSYFNDEVEITFDDIDLW